jgi:hypothetical protein
VDVVGRHAYSVFAAVPTTGSFPVAGFGYRYAGLRRPLLDLGASQDYAPSASCRAESRRRSSATCSGARATRRSRPPFVRPRVRSGASFSVGTGVERRDFATDPGRFLVQLDTAYQRAYTFPRLFVGATYSNVQRAALSISQEDGVALAVTVRERWRSDYTRGTRSTSVAGTAAAFKSLDLPGFAHHVLALRAAGGLADRRAGTSFEVGGTSGTVVDLFPGYTVGEGRRTFGVRGLPVGEHLRHPRRDGDARVPRAAAARVARHRAAAVLPRPVVAHAVRRLGDRGVRGAIRCT